MWLGRGTSAKFHTPHRCPTPLQVLPRPGDQVGHQLCTGAVHQATTCPPTWAHLTPSLPCCPTPLPFRFAEDLEIKLAISFALAQSTKLSALEERMRDTGKQLSYLPVMMAGARGISGGRVGAGWQCGDRQAAVMPPGDDGRCGWPTGGGGGGGVCMCA